MTYRLILASQSSGRLDVLKRAGVPAFPFVSNVDEDALLDHLPPTFSHSEIVASLAAAKAHRVFRILAALHKPESPYSLNNTDFLNSEITVAEYELAQQLTQELPGTAEILIFGCDSMLLLENTLTGKPHTPERAMNQIRKLSGASPVLYSGHCILKVNLRDLWENTLDTPNTSPVISNICADLFTAEESLSTAPLSVGKIKTFGILTQISGVSRSTVHFSEISESEAQAYVASAEPLKVAGGFTIDGLGGAFINGISGDYHGIVGISLPLLRQMANKLGVFWPHLWEQR